MKRRQQLLRQIKIYTTLIAQQEYLLKLYDLDAAETDRLHGDRIINVYAMIDKNKAQLNKYRHELAILDQKPTGSGSR